jgi:hypothetical protein
MKSKRVAVSQDKSRWENSTGYGQDGRKGTRIDVNHKVSCATENEGALPRQPHFRHVKHAKSRSIIGLTSRSWDSKQPVKQLQAFLNINSLLTATCFLSIVCSGPNSIHPSSTHVSAVTCSYLRSHICDSPNVLSSSILTR